MISQYHIARRLLKDPSFALEAASTFDKDFDKWINSNQELPAPQKGMGVFIMVDTNKSNKSYLVTNTVIDKLALLKIKKSVNISGINHFDWSVFSNVPNGQFTFIMPNNQCLRMNVDDTCMHFIWFDMIIVDKKKNDGHLHYHLFYISKNENWKPCIHFDSKQVQERQDLVFKLLCFIYLSETEEEIIKPGERKGTKKSGKVVNDLGEPITIINSKWNITSIRNEGFEVSGHFALRWSGAGRTEAKVVFIQPYSKNGYVRKSKISP